MTINQNTTTEPPENGFEERLLLSILTDFDELTQPAPVASARRDVPHVPLSLSWGVPAVVAAGVAAVRGLRDQSRTDSTIFPRVWNARLSL